jgi:uncharacterized protein YbjT (DUF2867 family)
MSDKPGLILVAGARGNQGGAVARRLLAQGWKVRAMTRHVDSEKSRALKNLGADLVQGDYEDAASLERAMDGAYGAFMPGFQASVRNLREAETRFGIAFLQSAKKAGVKHLVYASEAGSGTNAILGFLQSKQRIEALIRELGIPATILRHAFFLDWLAGPAGSMIWKGLGTDEKDERTFQVTCLEDAAAFAVVVFDNPSEFLGKDIEIAGDEVTHEQLSRAYQEATGKAPRASRMPLWLLSRMGDFGGFVADIPALSSHADIASLRASYPGLKKVLEAMRAAVPMLYPPK